MKIQTLTLRPHVMTFILPALGQQYRFTYSSLGVPCSSQRRTTTGDELTIFHIIMKIGGKSCNIIVDSGSCINAVSSTMITKFGLKAVPHSHPYRVTLINSSELEVKQRCLVPIDFGLYKDKI